MILKIGAPLLRQVAKPVSDFGSNSLKNLVADLFQIMADQQGAGLAAPQIGISKQIFVYGYEKNLRYPDAPPVPLNCIINPTITWESEEKSEYEEGCLSVPNVRGMVSRPSSIECEYFDVDGKQVKKSLSGFEARIFQHEIDHLLGRLFIDIALNVREFKAQAPTNKLS